MAKKGKFNIFALASRILRVGRAISEALSDDKKISNDERDEIIALLNKREEERKAVFAGGGGAIVTQEGTGLGSAR